MKSALKHFSAMTSVSVLALLLAGCASQGGKKVHDPVAKQQRLDQSLALFPPTRRALPKDWEPLILVRKKKPTEYVLTDLDGRTVLHAAADKASSGLRHEVSIDPARQPWLSWTWKTNQLIPGADNSKRDTEDSPVRIVLAFDGDRSKLSFMDTILFDTAKLISGHEFPYATLMYIWETRRRSVPSFPIPGPDASRCWWLKAARRIWGSG